MPQALIDQGVWEALNLEASIIITIRIHSHIHKSTLVTQAYQNALIKSPTIIKRHIHSP